MDSSDFIFTPVVKKSALHDVDESTEDIAFWLSKPPAERMAAVTFLVNQQLEKGQRLDKTVAGKRRSHEQ